MFKALLMEPRRSEVVPMLCVCAQTAVADLLCCLEQAANLKLMEDDTAVVNLLEEGQVVDNAEEGYLLLSPAGTTMPGSLPVVKIIQVMLTAKPALIRLTLSSPSGIAADNPQSPQVRTQLSAPSRH
jgi:hypothetical protein